MQVTHVKHSRPDLEHHDLGLVVDSQHLKRFPGVLELFCVVDVVDDRTVSLVGEHELITRPQVQFTELGIICRGTELIENVIVSLLVSLKMCKLIQLFDT